MKRNRSTSRALLKLLLPVTGAAGACLAVTRLNDPFQALVLSLAGLGLAVLTLPKWLRKFLTPVEAYVHEICHGLAAIVLKGKFHRFKLAADGTGVAYTSGEKHRVPVLMAGYLGVHILGLVSIVAGSFLAAQRFVLVGLFILFAVTVFRAGNFLAAFVGTAVLAMIGAAMKWLDPGRPLGTALRAFGCVLVVFGWGALFDQWKIARSRYRHGDSDAEQVARKLHIPGSLVAFWWLAIGSGLLAATFYTIYFFRDSMSG